MPPKEKSLTLIKECTFSAGGDVEVITWDVDLKEENSGSACPQIKAIQKYVDDRTALSKEREFNILFMFWEAFDRDQLLFYVNMNIMKYLREDFPEPFFEIRVVRGEANNAQESDPFNMENLLVLEKRFPIKDMLYQEQELDADQHVIQAMIAPFKNNFPVGTSFLCRIKLGWMQPVKKIKLCTQPIMENLFDDESSKDLTILAGNGAQVKCHKFVFTAQCPTFAAMFSGKTGMREATSKTVEMRENSEEGIRVLVRYLYGLELVIGDLASDIALELFQLAHQYGLSELEGSLLELFLEGDKEWFTPDVVLETYLYVRNLSMFEKLVDHSLSLMASMPTEELRSCEVFGKLDKAEQANVLAKLRKNFKKHSQTATHMDGGSGKRKRKRRRTLK